MDDGQTVSPKIRGNWKTRNHCLQVSSVGFLISPFCLGSGLWNSPTAPPINILIIPWLQFSDTVLFTKSGSHLQFQSSMQSCIQLCTGVKKILLPYQLTYPLFLFSLQPAYIIGYIGYYEVTILWIFVTQSILGFSKDAFVNLKIISVATVGDCGKTGRKNCAMECSYIGVSKGTYDAVKLEKGKNSRAARSYADITREDVQTPLGKNRLIIP